MTWSEDSSRRWTTPVITAADGHVVWDLLEVRLPRGRLPADTANPSLWRQGKLVAKHGLFELTDGVYQVRGLDLSNMTIVEGDTGVIIIDTLMSNETAAAALALYRKHRGDKAGQGRDHHALARRPLRRCRRRRRCRHPDLRAGRLPGTCRVGERLRGSRRCPGGRPTSTPPTCPAGPAGQIGAGLGQATSNGTISLMAPTVDVTHTGQEAVIDGVKVVFQVTPGTEAPAEMNFFFPDRRALCMAENATHTLHQILTLRGAEVRDARGWSRYLDEAIRLFGADTDVVFASHHWPVWGTERITTFLSQQRDTYAYLHDQTLRRMNQGLIGTEIAEQFELPPALAAVVEQPRLLRIVQPQRQGDLPALPRLVRRQPGAPVDVSAGGGGQALRRVHGRRGCRAEQGPQLLRRRRPALDGDGGQPCRLRRSDQSRGQGAAGPDPGAAGLRRGERAVAQHLPARRARSCAGPIAPPPPELASPEVLGALDDRATLRLDRRPHRRAERAAARPTSPSTGSSPTWTGPTAPSCPTAR